MPHLVGGGTDAPTIMVAEQASDTIKAARPVRCEAAPQTLRAFAGTESMAARRAAIPKLQ